MVRDWETKEINNMYTLIAQNNSGASVRFNADTIASVIRKFDSEYTRKGFKIWIVDDNGETVKQVKSTYN
jgi:SPX domain protein involved in polyphosphate accumulation